MKDNRILPIILLMSFLVACSPKRELLSYNNNEILFVSTKNDHSEIYLMNADGTGMKRITDNSAEDIDLYIYFYQYQYIS